MYAYMDTYKALGRRYAHTSASKLMCMNVYVNMYMYSHILAHMLIRARMRDTDAHTHAHRCLTFYVCILGQSNYQGWEWRFGRPHAWKLE